MAYEDPFVYERESRKHSPKGRRLETLCSIFKITSAIYRERVELRSGEQGFQRFSATLPDEY